MCCGDKQVWRKSINRGEKSDNTKAVLMSTPFLLLQNAVFPLVTTLNRVTDRFCYFCYNISHYYVTLVAEATVWLTHWPQATVFSWGNKLTQCPSTQWGRQILKCTRTSQDSSRWFGIIATAEIHYSKHFIWKEWPELCKQVHAWEIWMSLSSKVQQLRVYIPRPSPFNRKPKYEVREIMQHAGFFHWVHRFHILHDISWSFVCVFADTLLSIPRRLLFRWRCLPLCVGPQRMCSLFLAHRGPTYVTQYTHPYTQQYQLQSPRHAGVLQLPYVLPASTAMWKCTPTESLTEARRSLFPRIPALVTLQQKQCCLAPLHVNMLRHQLHPRQVKPKIKPRPKICIFYM